MKIKDFEIPIGNALFGSQVIKTGYKSLKKWLSGLISAANGIAFNSETFSFELGGEITEDTQIIIKEGKSFIIAGENGSGLFQVDDSGNILFLGSPADNYGINVLPDTINILAPTELNIVSNLLTMKDDDNNTYFILKKDSGTVFVKAPNLPEYDDEAAAIIGGIESDTIYKTTTGELRIKL